MKNTFLRDTRIIQKWIDGRVNRLGGGVLVPMGTVIQESGPRIVALRTIVVGNRIRFDDFSIDGKPSEAKA